MGAASSETLTLTVANAFDSPLRIGGTKITSIVEEDAGQTSLGLSSLQYISAKKIDPDTGEEVEERRELSFNVVKIPDTSSVGSLYKINSNGDYEIYEPSLVDGHANISLAELQTLQFSPLPNYSTNVANSSVTGNLLIFEVSDGVSTPVVEVVDIFVTPVNDAPTLDSSGATSTYLAPPSTLAVLRKTRLPGR